MVTKWDLKLDAEPQGSSNGFWYDLTDGGYIDLKKLLTNPDQIELANSAIATLKSLQDALEYAALLNEF